MLSASLIDFFFRLSADTATLACPFGPYHHVASTNEGTFNKFATPPGSGKDTSVKQVLQELRTGELIVEDVPTPRVPRGHLLIRTFNTLVSAGTARMLVEFGEANYLDKALQPLHKVKQVLDKVKTEAWHQRSSPFVRSWTESRVSNCNQSIKRARARND